MSEGYEGYEQQYCEISTARPLLQVRRRLRPRRQYIEKKKQKLSEIQADVQESESLIRRMDLEARSLQPSIKARLVAKLTEYKSDLSDVSAFDYSD